MATYNPKTTKPNFMHVIARRKRTLKQYLDEKNLSTKKDILNHVLELKDSFVFDDSFEEQLKLFLTKKTTEKIVEKVEVKEEPLIVEEKESIETEEETTTVEKKKKKKNNTEV